jgi:hypothetical protein
MSFRRSGFNLQSLDVKRRARNAVQNGGDPHDDEVSNVMGAKGREYDPKAVQHRSAFLFLD